MKREFPKFICTAGQRIMSKDILKKLYNAGMSHVRFNMSYRLECYSEMAKNIKELNEEDSCSIGLICDLAGSELRVNIEDNVEVKEGQQIVIGQDIFLNCGDLSCVKQNEEIIIKDGKIILIAIKYENDKLYCVSKSNGIISPNSNCYNKSMYEKLPFLPLNDEINLIDAIRYECDYIAVSHVRTKENLKEINDFLEKNNAKIKLISKIENKQAMENLDEIIDYSDGIMIARGDLGKILPIEELAYNQKVITKKTLAKGKYLMSATDYLFSLAETTALTRAEVVDLFTAYEDGILNILFTKEVALAKDPVYVLDVANKIYDSYLKYKGEEDLYD